MARTVRQNAPGGWLRNLNHGGIVRSTKPIIVPIRGSVETRSTKCTTSECS